MKYDDFKKGLDELNKKYGVDFEWVYQTLDSYEFKKVERGKVPSMENSMAILDRALSIYGKSKIK